MCEYDDKRGDCDDNILINAEIEDEAEAKKMQDDEDLFDLFILNEFLTCRDRKITGTGRLLPLLGGLNYIEKLLLISGFRFLSRGML